MDKKHEIAIGRRDLLRLVAAVSAGSTAAVVAASSAPADAAKKPKQDRGKRKSQYQPDSPEVQTYYRVNGYPKK